MFSVLTLGLCALLGHTLGVQGGRLSRGDLVASFASAKSRHALAHAAAKTWMKGIRGAVSTDEFGGRTKNSSKLIWYQHDDEDELREGQYKSDRRMVIAAVNTNETFWPDFKWMLFGDDDTFWFVDNLLDFLEPLDPDVPYIISDRLHARNRPKRSNSIYPPYCALSNLTEAPNESKTCKDSRRLQSAVPAIAPCTKDNLCRCVGNSVCLGNTYTLAVDNFFYGGGGAVISRGLLWVVGGEYLRECAHTRTGFGDRRLADCIGGARYGMGIGMTHASALRPRGAMPKFDCCTPGELKAKSKAYHDMARFAAKGVSRTPPCKMISAYRNAFREVITMHVSWKDFENPAVSVPIEFRKNEEIMSKFRRTLVKEYKDVCPDADTGSEFLKLQKAAHGGREKARWKHRPEKEEKWGPGRSRRDRNARSLEGQWQGRGRGNGRGDDSLNGAKGGRDNGRGDDSLNGAKGGRGNGRGDDSLNGAKGGRGNDRGDDSLNGAKGDRGNDRGDDSLNGADAGGGRRGGGRGGGGGE